MHNPYLEYYSNQAGSGITGFQGYKYQRGHGFFGNLFRTILLPLGKYLGKKALSTGVAIGGDILKGDNFKTSSKRRLLSAGESIVSDTLDKMKKINSQEGKGKKRRKQRKHKKRKTIKKKATKKKISLAKKKRNTSKLKNILL